MVPVTTGTDRSVDRNIAVPWYSGGVGDRSASAANSMRSTSGVIGYELAKGDRGDGESAARG